MLDEERVDDFLATIADRFTAAELVDLLGLTEWDIIEAFREQILNAEKGTF